MAQPTGPQAGAAKDPSPAPDPTAAGLDIWREISRPPHAGHFTSASSDFRRMSSSKDFAQRAQAYS